MATFLSRLLQQKAFTKEGFLIDCTEIRLVQNGGNGRSWSASGTLTVDFTKGITARLVSEESPERSQFDIVIEAGQVESGQILPQSHYFSLAATDVNGQLWTNPSVEVEEMPQANCTVLEVSCEWIRTTYDEPSTRDLARMLFLEPLKFPLNDFQLTEVKKGEDRLLRKTELVGATGDITHATVQYKNADTPEKFHVVSAAAKDGIQFPVYFASKLLETIRFVTASKISFCVSETVRSGIATLELAKATIDEPGFFPAPLAGRNIRHTADFFRLFDAFLKHALDSSNDDNFSPLAMKFYPLYGLRHVSLDSIALLISVTVEALINEQFPELGLPEEQVLQEVKVINDAIDKLAVSQRSKDRAKGSLGGMKKSRADDKLNALKSAGILAKEEILAWKGLRNASAHGSLHVDAGKVQELLDNVYTAATLLNKLALLAIGYTGLYTDHAERGWPEKEFPPRPEKEVVPPQVTRDGASSCEVTAPAASSDVQATLDETSSSTSQTSKPYGSGLGAL